jgi:hypothetical protein
MPAIMNRAVPSALTRNRHLMALVLGLFLGQVVTLMAQREGATMAGFGVSTLFIAAASASFVLFVLGHGHARQPVPRAVLSRQAHGLAATIGIGLLLSLGLVA